MKESQSTFKIFINEVRYYIFKLLCFLYRQKTIPQTIIVLLIITLLRLKVSIHTHEPSHSSYVLVAEGLNQLQDALGRWLSSNIQQYTYLWVELPTKPFKEPQMGG